MPLSFWKDAFVTVVHLMNCLPTKVLEGHSPGMRLFGKQLDIQFLKVFGCMCYPLLRPYNRYKLQYRSTPCVLLGYFENHMGYKCMDTHGHVYISRHVKFAEDVFPYQKIVNDSSSADISHRAS